LLCQLTVDLAHSVGFKESWLGIKSDWFTPSVYKAFSCSLRQFIGAATGQIVPRDGMFLETAPATEAFLKQ
jgi:hypothetical protein